MCEVQCSLMVRCPIHYFKSRYGTKFKIHYQHVIFTRLPPPPPDGETLAINKD